MITNAEQRAIQAHYAAEDAQLNIAKDFAQALLRINSLESDLRHWSSSCQAAESKIDRAKVALEQAKIPTSPNRIYRGIDAALKILSE